jgi:hypothetical protein
MLVCEVDLFLTTELNVQTEVVNMQD